MPIPVEVSAETEARLAVQAAARSMDVPAYVATLLVVTRNVRDFQGLGVEMFDPWD